MPSEENAKPHKCDRRQSITLKDSSLLEPSPERHLVTRDNELRQDASQALDAEPLSDKVIGLREWGGDRVFPLRAPRYLEDAATAKLMALQLTRRELVTAKDKIEIRLEGQTWRIKERRGLTTLKQDGRPTREVSLMSGTEVTIADRTFIAESPRSIALRNFCSRLLGWSNDRIAVVDHALRAIRTASAGRAPLTLTGNGDLVPIAHAIHRYVLGNEVPFIVSDPRRKNTLATVRTPANYPSGVEAFQKANGGSLCVRARRLPDDFAEILYAFREPDCSVLLMICAHQTSLPNATQIDIPSLASRQAEIPRIVCEYIEDAAHVLRAPDDCLDPQGIAWILDHAAHKGELTISGIEKAALRAVALKISGDLTSAAKLLKMARVSLERWIKRRNESPSESHGEQITE